LYIEARETEARVSAVVNLADGMKDEDTLPSQAIPLLTTLEKALTLSLRRVDAIWVDDKLGNNVHEQGELMRFGLCFIAVEDGAKALRLIEQEPNRYSVVISNFRRVDDPLQGYGLLEEMKRRSLRIPLIYYVSMFTPEQAADAKMRGAVAEVRGPIDLVSEVFGAIGESGGTATRLGLIAQKIWPCR
jgi:hypothetical protein